VARVPARLRFALANFALADKAVLDVGCGPGAYLARLGPRAVGLDIDPSKARAKGLEAVAWNFVERLPVDVRGRFEVVWCSNVFEHVLSPHEFLIRLREALVPDGLLLIAVPRTSWYRGRGWRGYLAADHVNFFTARTLRLTIERAGYDVGFVGAPSLAAVPRTLAGLLAGVGPVVLAAGRKVESWQYAPKCRKTLIDGEIVWKDSFVGD
jgi:SAM-dependent methyltransferase